MPREGDPKFYEALELMGKLHESKSGDYANKDNPLSNFDTSEYGLRMFTNPRDGAFVWPIFTKLARLSTLLNKAERPNNESIEDSFLDIANYILLWRTDYIRRKERIENIKNINITPSGLVLTGDGTPKT